MTQSIDNILLQEVIAGSSGYVAVTGVIESESESDMTKWLKGLLINQQNDSISSLRPADAFRLKQEIEEVNKEMPSITLNYISDFKNIIEASATIVCERMGIRKSGNFQQEPFCKRRTESDFARFRKRKKEELRTKYGIKVKGF